MPIRKDGGSRAEEVGPAPIDGWIGSRIRFLRNQKGYRAIDLAAQIEGLVPGPAASVFAGTTQLAGGLTGRGGTRDRATDDEQIGARDQCGLGGRDALLILDPRTGRTHAGRDERDVVAHGSPDRGDLKRRAHDGTRTGIDGEHGKPHGRVE